MIGPFAQFEGQLAWLATSCCPDQAKYLLGPVPNLESTPLLRDDNEGGPLDAPGVIVLAPSPEAPTHPVDGHAPHTVLVMRHAHRADEDDEDWTTTAARPWDPPLSQLGRVQAQEAGQQLLALQPSLQIAYVISSPFLRCLQTSAEAVKALNLPQGRWLVDWSMGEIAEPRLLLGGRPELEDQMEGRALESWMWGGTSSRDALSRWAQGEAEVSGVQPRPVLLPRPAPPYPETRESAIGRYEQELGYLVQGARGTLQGNCLVVTHGEAVRCAVNMMEPDATVYEVKHCSHVKFTRPPAAGAEVVLGLGEAGGPLGTVPLGQQGWILACKSGETGVSWFV